MYAFIKLNDSRIPTTRDDAGRNLIKRSQYLQKCKDHAGNVFVTRDLDL